MTTQTQPPEERLSKLEGVYEQVNERLHDLTQAVREGDANLRQVEANLREEIRQGDANLRAEMSKQFHTMLVLIGTFWATTLGGIIAILVRG